MTSWLSDLGHDALHSVRAMRRQPVFAAAVGVLAAAIGGTTAVFSLVDAVPLRELPYHDPATLVALTHETPGPLDPVAHVAAFCTLLSVAALASLIPLRQASRLDPLSALREE